MVVSSESQASVVLGVPPHVVARAFTDVTAIKEFGADRFVSCCVLETLQPPTAVGAVRRLTLDLPGLPQSILRERLAGIEEGRFRTCIRLDNVPCDAEDAHRSPFGVEGTRLLLNATTLITITAISWNPNRSFLEISTKFQVDIAVPPGGMHRASDNPIYRDIEQFWDAYVSRMAVTLEDYILSTVFPIADSQAQLEFEKEFVDTENEYCQWAARSCEKIPREEAMHVLERALNAWLRERRELKHQQLINAQLIEDATGSAAVAAAAAAAAAAPNAATALSTSTRHTSGMLTGELPFDDHSPPKPPHRTTATTLQSDIPLHLRTSPNNGTTEKQTVGGSFDVGMEKPQHVPFFSRGGGRCLSPNSGEDGVALQKVPSLSELPCSSTSPHRPAISTFEADLLQSFLTELGTINERAAQTLFSALDKNQEGFITEEGIRTVLSQMDPLGLYEDRDGTLRVIEECRQAVGLGVFRNTAISQSQYDRSTSGYTAAVAATTLSNNSSLRKSNDQDLNGKESSAEQLTPLQTLIRRHTEEKKAMLEEVIKKRAADMMNNYAYRTRGKLHYDEFCLMMLHLLKEY